MKTNSLLVLVFFVDDLLITSISNATLVADKRIFHDRLLMTDMGPLQFFLCIEINQDTLEIKLSKAKYSCDLLERFYMKDFKCALTTFLSGVKL